MPVSEAQQASIGGLRTALCIIIVTAWTANGVGVEAHEAVTDLTQSWRLARRHCRPATLLQGYGKTQRQCDPQKEVTDR
jgi:hypothetical protein